MNSVTISVIIPTCDRPKFLPEAIGSIHEQTLQPVEIIVANNGKESIPEGSLGEDVKVLNLEPYIGVSAARNEGAKTAKGDYLAFLDDDDKWDNEFLLQLTSKLTSENADCAVGDIYTFTEHSAPQKARSLATHLSNLRNRMLYRNPGFGGGNFLVKRAAFKAVGGFDPQVNMREDQVLGVELLMADYIITAEPLAIYYARLDSTSRLSAIDVKNNFQFYKACKKYMTLPQKVRHLWWYGKLLRKAKKKRSLRTS